MPASAMLASLVSHLFGCWLCAAAMWASPPPGAPAPQTGRFSIEWSKSVPGMTMWARELAVGANDDIFVTGNQRQSDRSFAFSLARLDARGDLAWQQPTGATAKTLREGDLAFASGAVVSASGEDLTRHFADGRLDWRKPSNETGPIGIVEAVATSPSGEIFVVGTRRHGTHGPSGARAAEIVVNKLSRDGAVLWRRAFALNTTHQRGMAIALGSKGQVFIAGISNGQLTSDPHAGAFDVLVAKLDAKGGLLWQHQFGTRGTEFVTDMQVNAADEVFLVGTTTASFTDTSIERQAADTFAAKLTAQGKLAWTVQWGQSDPRRESVSALAISSTGSLYVVGSTQETPRRTHARPIYQDAFITKVSDRGKVEWTERWVGRNNLQSIAITSGGALYLAGRFDPDSLGLPTAPGSSPVLLKVVEVRRK